ncbi:MAG: Lrp/AsnC family transcriptional regulator [Promethearchaeia archaeon]
MLSEKAALDEVDKKIIELVQGDPHMTHTKIAKKVKRSQPTVGLRIKKLEESGFLQLQAGTNLSRSNMQLAKIEIQTNDPEEIEKIIRECPLIIHGYRLTGKFNFNIILIGSNIRELNEVINHHFRKNPSVYSIREHIITEFINDLVLPIDLRQHQCDCS